MTYSTHEDICNALLADIIWNTYYAPTDNQPERPYKMIESYASYGDLWAESATYAHDIQAMLTDDLADLLHNANFDLILPASLIDNASDEMLARLRETIRYNYHLNRELTKRLLDATATELPAADSTY